MTWQPSVLLRLCRAAAPAAALLLVISAGPAAAGGDLCDPAFSPNRCGLPPAVAIAPPPPPLYAYEYRAAPTWTANGWSYPPTRPVYGDPPPGPFVYMPPAYAVPYVPCVADCSRFPLFPWNWRRW
jgi:hypothetical protein